MTATTASSLGEPIAFSMSSLMPFITETKAALDEFKTAMENFDKAVAVAFYQCARTMRIGRRLVVVLDKRMPEYRLALAYARHKVPAPERAGLRWRAVGSARP